MFNPFKANTVQLRSLAKITLISTLIIALVSSYLATKIGFDYDYERYFPQDDESQDFFKEYQETFGSDNDFLLLGIQNKSGVFNADFLQKIKVLGDAILTNPSVTNIISPVHNLVYLKKMGLQGIGIKNYIDTSFTQLTKDSILIGEAPKLYGNIFSETSPSISIFIQTKENMAKAPSDILLAQLNKWIEDGEFDETHLSGRILVQKYYLEKMMWETAIFITSAILLVIIFLLIAFKNFWGVIIPLITVIFALITTIAIMFLMGKQFDILMVMLPTIVFVVGMSDIVHLLSKYLDEIRNGLDKYRALLKAYKEVGLATFLTSITTAIGFFSLQTASIVPIKEFGLYCGIAVFVAYFYAFTLLPAIYVLIPPPIAKDDATRKFNWIKALNTSFMAVFKYRRAVVATYVIVVVLSVFGAAQLKVNNYLLEDLDKSDPVRKDFEFFEQHFAGVRPFELKLIALNGTKITDYANIVSIDILENYLVQNYADGGVGFMISPTDPIKMANYIKYNNQASAYVLPNSEKRYQNIQNLFKEMSGGSFNDLSLVLNEDSTRGRISGKIRDVGGYKMKAYNTDLTQFIQDSIQNPNLQATLTGSAILIDKNNESLAMQLITGLLFALLIVGVIMALVFKSLKMVVISLIPNVMPLIIIAGLMYVMGFDIKISTTLFFTLAFGIAVDDTIHLLSKLRLELNKGHSFVFALRRTYISTGKAIIVTTLILCSGFLTLMMSDFTSIYTMGLFVCIALFVAVITDLTILPLILIKWLKPKNQSKL